MFQNLNESVVDHVRALAVFTVVAECRSFRGAARQLRMSPSVVSQLVSGLETHYGVTLLYRSTRRLTLTPQGEQLRTQGRTSLQAAETGLLRLSQQAEMPAGLIRVTVSAILQEGPFIDDVQAFLDAFPRVRMDLRFSDTPRQLVEGGVDLLLATQPVSGSNTVTRQLLAVPQALYASPDYIARVAPIMEPSDLGRCEWLASPNDGEELRCEQAGQSYVVTPERTLTVDTTHAARSFALRGRGIAVLPRFFADEALATSTLVEVLPGYALPAFAIYAAHSASAGRASLPTVFLSFLAARLAAGPRRPGAAATP